MPGIEPTTLGLQSQYSDHQDPLNSDLVVSLSLIISLIISLSLTIALISSLFLIIFLYLFGAELYKIEQELSTAHYKGTIDLIIILSPVIKYPYNVLGDCSVSAFLVWCRDLQK